MGVDETRTTSSRRRVRYRRAPLAPIPGSATASEWMCHTLQLCFTRVKNSMVEIKYLMKCYDAAFINICVIIIIGLCLLLCDVTQ